MMSKLRWDQNVEVTRGIPQSTSVQAEGRRWNCGWHWPMTSEKEGPFGPVSSTVR